MQLYWPNETDTNCAEASNVFIFWLLVVNPRVFELLRTLFFSLRLIGIVLS